jgi:D-serine deaminase-like pyridoxal phosphate-dependent protein
MDTNYRNAVGTFYGNSLTILSTVISQQGTPGLSIGERVEMVPSHIDPTINLHDFYYAHRRGVIEEIWAVDSRGKFQ